MKVVFRIIGSEEDLQDVEEKEENVHFCFRPSEKNIFELVTKTSKLKRIQLPSSYQKTISNTTKTLLKMKNIKLLTGDIWGHRTDIDRLGIFDYPRKKVKQEFLSQPFFDYFQSLPYDFLL